MNFKRFSITALQVIGLGLLPTAALANTTNTVTYSATVPGNCTFTYANGQDETVTLSYDQGEETLTGSTGAIGITCNYNASATLSAVDDKNSPVEGETFTLALNNGSTDVISTDGASASSATSLGLTNGVETSFTMDLTVDGATDLGTYEYEVVLTVLDS